MPDSHVAGFAKVQSGWTGTLAATVSSVTVTVTPSSMGNGRESAASVTLRLLRDCREKFGGTWSAYPNANGTITIDSSHSFSLVGSSNTATRTGFATYSAAYSITSSAHPDGVYPMALAFDGLSNIRQPGRVGSDGGAATPSIWSGTGHTAKLTETWANVRSMEATLLPEGKLLTADLWCSDFSCGRFVITQADTGPATRDMAYWEINMQLRAVS